MIWALYHESMKLTCAELIALANDTFVAVQEQDSLITRIEGQTYVCIYDFEQDLSSLQTKPTGEVNDGDIVQKQVQEPEDGVSSMVCAIISIPETGLTGLYYLHSQSQVLLLACARSKLSVAHLLDVLVQKSGWSTDQLAHNCEFY